MVHTLSRREVLCGFAGAPLAVAVTRPNGILVDTHVHLFADDQKHFPYHRNATYKPPAQPLEAYLKFVKSARIDRAVIVHPEPYQDDHRYLEYCFEHEPSRGFFKGTCLFDPIAPDTPSRMEALVKKHPGRIVALRIHENRDPKSPPKTSGPIRERDLRAPAMKITWGKAQALGLAIQMHLTPWFASQIHELAAAFPETPVILDHMARAGEGTPSQYDEVLALAKLPRVYMKFSALQYSSREPYPYRDTRQLVRRTFDAFGPDRMIWGGLGMNMAEFEKQVALFDTSFDFANESDRAKIRGLNAMTLFRFH